MRLVNDRLIDRDFPVYARVVLDPSTQMARYFDSVGRPVELGKHGTNKAKATASMSGGGDGKGPAPQTRDDTTTDYEPD
jgi:putative ATP-grasp target RiPP